MKAQKKGNLLFVYLPRRIRGTLGLQKGDRLDFWVDEKELTVKLWCDARKEEVLRKRASWSKQIAVERIKDTAGRIKELREELAKLRREESLEKLREQQQQMEQQIKKEKTEMMLRIDDERAEEWRRANDDGYSM